MKENLIKEYLRIIFEEEPENYYNEHFIVGDYDYFLLWSRKNMMRAFKAEIIEESKIKITIYSDFENNTIEEEHTMKYEELEKGKRILLYWTMDVIEKEGEV